MLRQNCTGRRNVVRRNRIADHDERPGAANVLRLPRLLPACRRKMTVLARTSNPGPTRTSRRRARATRATAHRRQIPRIPFPEHFRLHRLRDRLTDFVLARPNVSQVDGVAVFVVADRIVAQVDVHRAGDGVRDDEQRRRQIVRLHQRVDAAFEVAVAAQHRRHDQIVVDNLLCHVIQQRAAVADARRAAVADDVEA